MVGVDERVLSDNLHAGQHVLEDAAHVAHQGAVAWGIDLADDVFHVVATVQQEVAGNAGVVHVVDNFVAVGSGDIHQRPFIDGHSHGQAGCAVETILACLENFEDLLELSTGHYKRLQLVLKREHVVEMLVLQHAGIPRCPERSGIYKRKVDVALSCFVVEVGNEVAELRLFVLGSFQKYIVLHNILEIGLHQRQPFVKECLHSIAWSDILAVEFPFGELTGSGKILRCHIGTPLRVCEDSFADGDGSFNRGVHKFASQLVECEVQQIEVESAVDVPNDWDAVLVEMDNFVAVALNNSVNRPVRQQVENMSDGTIGAGSLVGRLLPGGEVHGLTGTAVPLMRHDHDSVSSIGSERLRLREHNIRELLELIVWEQMLREPRRGGRRIRRYQPNNPNLEVVVEREYLTSLGVWQERRNRLIGLTIKIGRHELTDTILEILVQEIGSEVELVVAQRRRGNSLSVEELIDDHTVAHQFTCFDSSLEMVATIQIKHIILTVFFFDDVDDACHGSQPTIRVFLFGVRSDELGGVGGTVDIIGSYYHERLFVQGDAWIPGGLDDQSVAHYGDHQQSYHQFLHEVLQI